MRTRGHYVIPFQRKYVLWPQAVSSRYARKPLKAPARGIERLLRETELDLV